MYIQLWQLAGVFAPFPPSHPYSFLNPVLDPWWHDLEPATQKQIYSMWEKVEPLKLSLANQVIMKAFIPKIDDVKIIRRIFDIYPG